MAALKRVNKVRLRVRGQLDGAGGDQEGTLTIDPVLGAVTVKPKNKHQEYTVTLREVADFVCKRVLLGKRPG